jgi:hypothetical protein
MTQFISKLQYKTCEKGEFFDEQARTFDETLTLIKNFPWNDQRGADVQLSGPGIVIEGPDGDYLKIALYFNGKFNAYYLDAGNHLYEYHTADINDDCTKVKEFFTGTLNREGFEKHFFNIGNRAHFTTANFEYTITAWRAGAFPLFMCLYALLLTTALIRVSGKLTMAISLIIVMIGTLISTYRYAIYRNSYLKLSKGHDDFLFGEDKNNIIAYNKQDIKEVIIYERQSRNYSYDSAKIILNNGTVLKLPGLLISNFRLMSKFSDKVIRIERLPYWSI